MIVYIGTYTGGESRGIYVGDFDPATGRLTLTGVTPLEHPSFLALDSPRLRLYAVSEVRDFGGRPGGGVSAFAVEPGSGRLTFLNSAPSGGASPCHLGLDPAGRFVLAANYAGGGVAFLPLTDEGRLTGTAEVVSHAGLSEHPLRRGGPRPHSITMDPAGRYALAVDLGLDLVRVYEIAEAEDRLALRLRSQTATKAGAGPRHLAFHPSRRDVYIINELDSTLTAWRYDAERGRLSQTQVLSTVPDGFTGANFPADVHVHPSGRFVYGSNRGHDSIAVFAVDPGTGRLSPRDIVPAGGRNPRGFAIDPTGRYLLVAHQDTNTVAAFTIDAGTGGLSPTGACVSVPSPVCVTFLCPPSDA